MVTIKKLDALTLKNNDPKLKRKLDLKMLELNEKTDPCITIFGEQSFIDKEMVKIITQQRIIEEQGIIKAILDMGISVDKERLERWIQLCLKLETIDEQDLVDIATHKKFMELHHEINKLKTEVKRHKQALHLVCEEAHGFIIESEGCWFGADSFETFDWFDELSYEEKIDAHCKYFLNKVGGER